MLTSEMICTFRTANISFSSKVLTAYRPAANCFACSPFQTIHAVPWRK